jgi:hypothetical protein
MENEMLLLWQENFNGATLTRDVIVRLFKQDIEKNIEPEEEREGAFVSTLEVTRRTCFNKDSETVHLFGK